MGAGWLGSFCEECSEQSRRTGSLLPTQQLRNPSVSFPAMPEGRKKCAFTPPLEPSGPGPGWSSKCTALFSMLPPTTSEFSPCPRVLLLPPAPFLPASPRPPLVCIALGLWAHMELMSEELWGPRKGRGRRNPSSPRLTCALNYLPVATLFWWQDLPAQASFCY